jgi:hypothetical protein
VASQLISDRERHSRWGLLDSIGMLSPIWAPVLVLFMSPDLSTETRTFFMLAATGAGVLVAGHVVRRILRDYRKDRTKR